MNIDRWVFRIAGLLVLTSLALGFWVSLYWLLLAAFVGLNMFQASFTGFCPLARILHKLGIRPGVAFEAKSLPVPTGSESVPTAR